MNNKYIARLTVASILFLSVPGVILASDSASNTNTGNRSTNNATITNNRTSTTTNVNDSNVTNNVSLDLTSGNNSANGNTKDGFAQGGDIDANVNVNNITGTPNNNIFSNTTTVQSDTTVSNSNTGNRSTNNALSTQRTVTTVNNVNRATANNNIRISANSGDNDANGNTGNGTARGGAIRVNVNLDNRLNTDHSSNPFPQGPGGNNGGSTVHPTINPPAATVNTVKPATKTEVVLPRPGVGGGYFPAGGNWMPLLGLLFFVSFAISYADKLSVFLARPIPVTR